MIRLENTIPPPIVTIFFAVVMWGISLADFDIELNIILRGTIMAILLGLSVFFIITGILSFRKAATTISPLKPEAASALVCSGIYQISRNPMYVGLLLLLLAWGVYLSSFLSLFAIAGFVYYLNRFQIIPEEQALLSIFGSEFEDYQLRVRRWL